MQNSFAQDLEVSDMILGILEKQNCSVSTINSSEIPVLAREMKAGKRGEKTDSSVPVSTIIA